MKTGIYNGIPAADIKAVSILTHGKPDQTVTPSFLPQEVAPVSAALTALIFSTPFVDKKSSSAWIPLVAYIGMPSFQVARPQRTPE